MSWYRFIKGEIKGRLKVKRAQVCFYDMTRGGSCFDESFIENDGDDVETLEEMGKWLTYIETDPNANNCDKSRVFVHMDDGEVYELQMRKLSPEEWKECSKFNGGRENKNK